MDIQELIDTLNNVADKTVRVKVTSPHGIVGTVGVLLAADGVQIITDEAIDAAPPADAPVPVTSVEFPSILQTIEDVRLNWPESTCVVDNVGDVYKRVKGVWHWHRTVDGRKRRAGTDDTWFLESYLPATVI